MTRRKTLTDEDWRNVFKIRCLSKQGQGVTSADLAFLEKALHEDPDRYAALNLDVFNATLPFGATRRTR